MTNAESLKAHGVELDEVNYLDIDGVRCVSYSFVAEHANRNSRNGYRYWQAFYNILSACGQSGLPHPWPELFYEEVVVAGHRKFHAKMDVIDDFIFPRSGQANVQALVIPTDPPLQAGQLIAA